MPAGPLGLLAVLLLAAKGAAGVAGAAFVVLAPTLAAVGTVPVESVALILLGIHRDVAGAHAYEPDRQRGCDARHRQVGARARRALPSAAHREGPLRNNSAKCRETFARIVPQGSFTNRTNTRLDADIDLRIQHPMLKIEYGSGVDAGTAWRQGGYYNTGVSFGYASDRMRAEIRSELIAAFGALALDDSGNKAIRVKGLEGSRSEVDVVPCFTLHHITGQTLLGQTTVPGTAILSKDKANWTLNYPDQDSENGRTKRLNTGLHFKRVVRVVKRLRADMTERGILRDKVPSFLVECLIYLVEDRYFTEPSDDRYGRVSRVLNRLAEIFANPPIAYTSYEINGIKLLFAGGQAWTLDTARNFVNLAVSHIR